MTASSSFAPSRARAVSALSLIVGAALGGCGAEPSEPQLYTLPVTSSSVPPAAIDGAAAPPSGGGGSFPQDPGVTGELFFDPSVSDASTLALDLERRLAIGANRALVEINAASLAGDLSDEQLGCLDGGYPYVGWFCGTDGATVPWPVGAGAVQTFDTLRSDTCELGIASGLDEPSCALRYVEMLGGDGGAARYRLRLVDGRRERRISLAPSEADLIDAGAPSEGVCRLVLPELTGAPVGFEDEAVCESLLRTTLAGF